MKGANVMAPRRLLLRGSESSGIDEQCGSELGWLLCWQNCPEERIRLAGFVGKRPRQRNLWVTDKSNSAGRVRLAEPANPLPDAGLRLVFRSSCLSEPV
jgi:hypothetical protein